MNIKPLDAIFFKGTELVSKSIIKFQEIVLGKGEWSHVGLVINKSIMPSLNVKDDELYIWESTISSDNSLITNDPTLDAESQKPVFGVQIRKLSDVIANSNKNGVELGYAKLLDNPIDKKDTESEDEYKMRLYIIRNKLNALHKRYYHRTYEINICRLFAALLSCCFCCRSSCCIGKRWKFCSQFVAIVYQNLGLLSNKFDAAVIVPQDLATPAYSEENLPIMFDDIKKIESDTN